MSKRTVEFKFDVNDVVNTPFVDGARITMLGVESEDVISYYVENTEQGVANKWFRASDLTAV